MWAGPGLGALCGAVLWEAGGVGLCGACVAVYVLWHEGLLAQCAGGPRSNAARHRAVVCGVACAGIRVHMYTYTNTMSTLGVCVIRACTEPQGSNSVYPRGAACSNSSLDF